MSDRTGVQMCLVTRTFVKESLFCQHTVIVKTKHTFFLFHVFPYRHHRSDLFFIKLGIFNMKYIYIFKLIMLDLLFLAC